MADQQWQWLAPRLWDMDPPVALETHPAQKGALPAPDARCALQAEPGPPPPYPQAKAKITNWPAYDAALRQRSSLVVWFSDKVLAAWRSRATHHTWWAGLLLALAITTALTLRAVFRLAHGRQ